MELCVTGSNLASPSKQIPPSSCFYPVKVDVLPETFIEKARRELNETEQIREEAISELKRLLLGKRFIKALISLRNFSTENNINFDTPDIVLLCFLRAKKFDIKRSFQLCQKYQAYKKKNMKYFTDMDVNVLKKVLRENFFGFLRYRDEEGSIVVFFRTGVWNPTICTVDDVVRAFLAVGYYSLHESMTQISGFVALLDSKAIVLDKLPQTIRAMKILLPLVLNCFPARYKMLHVVNQSSLFNSAWRFVNLMIPKKQRKRIMFHGSDFKSLHKYLPPPILPSDYGGELEPFNNDHLLENADSVAECFSRHSGIKRDAE